MGISTSTGSGGKIIIKIQGRFDFSVHQDFKNAYENNGETASSYEVDMRETSYLDSSALGMLLLLRDHAGGDSSSITLSNTSEDVNKILTISNFEQLFTIS